LCKGLPWDKDGEAPMPVLSPHGDVDVFLAGRCVDCPDYPDDSVPLRLVAYVSQVLGMCQDTVELKDQGSGGTPGRMCTLFAPELPRPVQVVLHMGVLDVYGFLHQADLAHCQAAVSATTGVVFSAVALAAWVSNITWIVTEAQAQSSTSLLRLAVASVVLKYNRTQREMGASDTFVKGQDRIRRKMLRDKIKPPTPFAPHTARLRTFFANGGKAETALQLVCCPLANNCSYIMIDGGRHIGTPHWAHARLLQVWAAKKKKYPAHVTRPFTVHGYVDTEWCVKSDGSCDLRVLYMPPPMVRQLVTRVNAMLGTREQQFAMFGSDVVLFEDAAQERLREEVDDGEALGDMISVPMDPKLVEWPNVMSLEAKALDMAKFMACKAIVTTTADVPVHRFVAVPVTVTVEGWTLLANQVAGVIVGCQFGHV
jgi:hypothetical protein